MNTTKAPPRVRGSRSNKTRAGLKTAGLVRIELWVPPGDVPMFKDLEAERSRAAVEAAQGAGVLSVPRQLTSDERRRIGDLVLSCERTQAEVARDFGVAQSTVSRIVNARRMTPKSK